MEQSVIPARQKFIDAARPLFAERGFYGVSIAAVARELGLTKQSVLHHFRTKEALYSAVLEQLADRHTAVLQNAGEGAENPRARLASALSALFHHMMDGKEDSRIIMRELVDNAGRAPSSHKWYMREFLEELVRLLHRHPAWHEATDGEIAAGVYQLVGAINYFAISAPTLRGIWSEEHVSEMEDAFLAVLLKQAARGR